MPPVVRNCLHDIFLDGDGNFAQGIASAHADWVFLYNRWACMGLDETQTLRVANDAVAHVISSLG